MDPPSGAPPSLDPCISQEPISQSDNVELLGSDPPVLSSHMAMSSRDPSHSAAPIQSVQELPAANQLPDASSAPAAPDTKLSAEKAQRSTTSSPSKKSHHSSAGDARASMQNKSVQSNRSSSQNRAVQWVRVSPPTQAAQKSGNSGTQEMGDSGKQGSKECAGMASLSTEVRQKQAAEEIKVSDECVVGSSIEVLEGQTVGPLSSSKTSHHPAVPPPLLSENAPQEAVEDFKILGVSHQAAEDPEILGFGHQAAEDHEMSSIVAHQAEEQSVLSPSSAVVVEDEQTSEPQQRSLSRTSSLSAKAREFVPKSVSVPSAPPAMPPQMHSSVMPPLMIPLNSAQGILSMFPPSSPLPSPQLGGFTLPMSPMVGPPPPPIPASLMGPMPILGPPHPGLLNVQLPGPPPPPVIPPPGYIIHSPSSNVPPHLPPAPLMDPLVNQVVNPNAEVGQDQQQSQDSDPASAQPGGAKPVLTEELKAKIVKQVEFYFSDANLPTDYHLMKFVKKDPEGFVPIATVAGFRKVRNLMKNYALVATALRSSKQLVVSQDGKKVRRLHPLPHVDLEEIQSRTVVAENLPADHSVESIEQLFGSVGNVKMVRICEPEASNGTNQTAKFTKADMVVSNKLHALVEFETVEQAERSVHDLTDQRNWRSGLHVRLLLRRTNNKHPASKSHKMNEGADGSTVEDDAAPPSSDNATERVGEEGHTQERSDELPAGSDNSHFDASSKKGRGRGRGGRGRGRGQFHPNGGRSHPVGTPPQANSLPNIEAKPPLGPRMPDGTRGFTLGRGKLVTTTNSV